MFFGCFPNKRIFYKKKNYVFEVNLLIRSFSTYFGLGLMIIIGNIKDFALHFKTQKNKNVAKLLSGFDDFFIRRMYRLGEDAWNRKIRSCPGDTFLVEDPLFKDRNGRPLIRKCINMGSYNYLGFASPQSPTLSSVMEAIETYSIGFNVPRGALSTKVVQELEYRVAKLTRKEAAAVFSMGFGCNSTFLPFLARKGDLILSDSKNHSSIVTGCFASSASTSVFRHNDSHDLERKLRKAIVEGHARTRRPWKRIFVLIEGLYSMEGYYPNLRKIVNLKKQYKFYLFVDEAHSFGAIGLNGRGICDQLDVDSKAVDILMGTFTKSHGGFGGFIASSKDLIEEVKDKCAGYFESASIPPAVSQQVSAAMAEMESDSGLERLKRLRNNSNFFRSRLEEMGFEVLGIKDSPVVIIVVGAPSNIILFSRECLRRNVL
ncbi:serine palmitoyltransferase component, variant 2 [Bonamia ostreae]|uniref:Serine palmitoyltransferase component, variant 2 n=1 Tax=Bonamia ostreae TaxID=126728 RepID=A0ABV2AHY8_9EUKA